MNLDDFEKIRCTDLEYWGYMGPAMRIDNGDRSCAEFFKLVPKKNLLEDLPITHPCNPHHKEGRNFSDRKKKKTICPECYPEASFIAYSGKPPVLERCILHPKPDRFAKVDEAIDELGWVCDPMFKESTVRSLRKFARAIVELIEKEKS